MLKQQAERYNFVKQGVYTKEEKDRLIIERKELREQQGAFFGVLDKNLLEEDVLIFLLAKHIKLNYGSLTEEQKKERENLIKAIYFVVDDPNNLIKVLLESGAYMYQDHNSYLIKYF